MAAGMRGRTPPSSAAQVKAASRRATAQRHLPGGGLPPQDPVEEGGYTGGLIIDADRQGGSKHRAARPPRPRPSGALTVTAWCRCPGSLAGEPGRWPGPARVPPSSYPVWTRSTALAQCVRDRCGEGKVHLGHGSTAARRPDRSATSRCARCGAHRRGDGEIGRGRVHEHTGLATARQESTQAAGSPVPAGMTAALIGAPVRSCRERSRRPPRPGTRTRRRQAAQSAGEHDVGHSLSRRNTSAASSPCSRLRSAIQIMVKSSAGKRPSAVSVPVTGYRPDMIWPVRSPGAAALPQCGGSSSASHRS